MDQYLKPKRPITPGCTLPENTEMASWRYMDFWKFESLLKEKALYLRRADLLQDRFEGTYSQRQIIKMEEWFKKINESEMINHERKRRSKDREKTYISCWCLSDYDLDLMWKAYISDPPGVAIKSSIVKLQKICDDAITHWPLDISIVNYFDHDTGENINYFGAPTVFLYKDHHFRLDNEIRIIHWPNISGPTSDHVFLPVNLNDMIEEIVLQPKSGAEMLNKTLRILEDPGLNQIPVSYSRDDRELIK